MTEVLQTCYREPTDKPKFGWEGGEKSRSRSAWDDVDDYHKWSASPPETKDGTAIAGADGWTRQVTVEYVRLADPSQTSGSDEGLKRITVTAIGPTGERTTLQALRGQAGIYDQQPDTRTTYVGWVGVELEIGQAPAGRISSGTNLLNPVPVSQ